MTCERCRAPLTQRQGRFCSVACRVAIVRPARRPDRVCDVCQHSFHPTRRKQVFCRAGCARRAQPARLLEVLTLLRATTHTWLTMSDIAIWIYGDDSPADCRAVRMVLLRLRRPEYGHRLEWRAATWEREATSQVRAYRLATDVREVVAA